MSDAPLIVNCSHFAKPGGFLSRHFGDRLRWSFIDADSGGYWSWLKSATGVHIPRIKGGIETAFQAVRNKASLVVSHDPLVTNACSFFLGAARHQGPHLAFSFNFATIPQGIRLRMMRSTFQAIDRFVVYSTMERNLYHEAFGIPFEKMDFIYWGVNPPLPDPNDRPLVEGDYLCAIGGNSRDYKTLFAAMNLLPQLRLIAVVRPENLLGLSVPTNVEVRTNIAYGEAMNILAFSRFMALPLAGSEVPCGHVTLVGAMHLGKTFVISNSTGINDYVLPEQNALVCEPFSPEAMAASIKRLWEDRELCDRLGNNGKDFATANCSEASTLKWFTNYLTQKGLLSNSDA